MENQNNKEPKGRLDIMDLIIIGLCLYSFYLVIKALFFLD